MDERRSTGGHGFFAVLGEPRSYLKALYLLLILPVATVGFTVVVTGLSVGAGLMVVALLGVPVLIGLWYAIHALLRVERALATSLVGVDAGPLDPLPAWPGGLWAHFKGCMRHGPTWRAASYLLLRFPVAIAVFTVAVTLISVSLGMTFAPTYMWASDAVTWGDRSFDPFWWSFLLVPIGACSAVASLHIMNALAVSCARWSAWTASGRRASPTVSVAADDSGNGRRSAAGDPHAEMLDLREPSPIDPVGAAGTGPTRAVTPARLVALAVIGLVAALLVAVSVAGGEDRLSVPEDARAGQLTLTPCTYPTEDGGYAADCGSLVVPEDRADPQSRLIAIPVKRVRARTAGPAEPIFRLEGGPGITNMDFDNASRFAATRDVVLVGYRGVDGSVGLDCPEVTAAVRRGGDVLSEKSLDARADAFRSCAERLTDDGIDVTQYGVVQQVDDLEDARRAFGYDRIDLLSESAGTRTALIYAWRYPDSIYRSVMIGANPPGHFMWDAQTTDEQLARYAELCAEDPSCRTRSDDLAATIAQENADLPDRWLAFPIKDGNARTVSFFGLMESTTEAPIANAPSILDAWLEASDGDASGLWFASLAGDLLLPRMFVWGQYAAFGSIDQQAARDYFAGGAGGRDTNLGYAASATTWGAGLLADAWPAAAETEQYQQARTSHVETLLIGGPLDFSTPPENATEDLLPYLPNGHQVVLEGFGHSFSFWTEQPDAGTRLVTTFLDRGQVDDSLYEPQGIDFTPSPTGSDIAKLVVAALGGLAFLALASLVGMWAFLQRRPRFGRIASGTIRTVSPLVVGLGAWSLAVLFALIVLPSVPLDSGALAVLPIGVSVGLAVFLAWVDRARPAAAHALGFAVAVAGGLLGTWLGLAALDAPLVDITTGVIGAAVGANLLLLGLDIVRDQRWRDRGASPLLADGPPQHSDAVTISAERPSTPKEPTAV